MLAVDNFSTRRRDVYAVMSYVNGVDRFHADQAEVVCRYVRRLDDGSCQLLYRGALTGRCALSSQGAFLERFSARIAANGRCTVYRFRSFVSVVRPFLVLGLDGGLGVAVVYVRGFACIGCVLAITCREIDSGVGVLFSDVGGVIAIFFHW